MVNEIVVYEWECPICGCDDNREYVKPEPNSVIICESCDEHIGVSENIFINNPKPLHEEK